MAAKVAKIEIFPLSLGYSCTTLWVKNSLVIAVSLTVCKIFVSFHIFTKSSNKVAITHLYTEQQLQNLNMLHFFFFFFFIMYLYSAQYLHILQDSKRYLTNPTVQIQPQLTSNSHSPNWKIEAQG